jgi:hypothetical protein
MYCAIRHVLLVDTSIVKECSLSFLRCVSLVHSYFMLCLRSFHAAFFPCVEFFMFFCVLYYFLMIDLVFVHKQFSFVFIDSMNTMMQCLFVYLFIFVKLTCDSILGIIVLAIFAIVRTDCFSRSTYQHVMTYLTRQLTSTIVSTCSSNETMIQ